MLRRLVCALALCAALVPSGALAWNRGSVTTFASLPPGSGNPEGIAVDDDGHVYVTTFAVNRASGPGELLVFRPNGTLLRALAIAGSSRLLLDLAFHPLTGALLVIDFGLARVLAVDPVTGDATVFAAIPDIDPSPAVGPGPNALAFDDAGNVYVSDSFQGVVWRIGPGGGEPTAWLTHDRLRTAGVPPFGANGLAFDSGRTALFIANTGDDTVLRVPVAGDPLVAGAPAVFANSVNGADGLLVDEHDNVWVVANQANEIVVLNPAGKTIAKLGDFDGIRPDGAVKGLLFPASIARWRNVVYVTNLVLDLRLFSGDFTTGDSAWTAQVTRHTVARIPAIIPAVPGGP